MVHLPGRVLDGRKDILVFEIRIVIQDFLETRPATEEFKNVRHPDPHSPDAGSAAALRVIDRDSTKLV